MSKQRDNRRKTWTERRKKNKRDKYNQPSFASQQMPPTVRKIVKETPGEQVEMLKHQSEHFFGHLAIDFKDFEAYQKFLAEYENAPRESSERRILEFVGKLMDDHRALLWVFKVASEAQGKAAKGDTK